jgi:hypothetical protein
MEANIINTSNINQIMNLYFRVYSIEAHNKFKSNQIPNNRSLVLNRDKIKEKFKTLRQKVGNKLRGENSVKYESDSTVPILNSENTVIEASRNSRGDLMERLRKRYKVSKEKVNHNLLNLQKFYQKRLDEKESTKLKKSIAKFSLFSSFLLVNFYVFTRKRIFFRMNFFILNSAFFLISNLTIQRIINSHYKERIRELGMENLKETNRK